MAFGYHDYCEVLELATLGRVCIIGVMDKVGRQLKESLFECAAAAEHEQEYRGIRRTPSIKQIRIIYVSDVDMLH